MNSHLLGAPVGFAGAAAAVNSLQETTPDLLATLVQYSRLCLEGHSATKEMAEVAARHSQALRCIEHILRSARQSGASRPTAAKALTAHTDLTAASVAALVEAVADLASDAHGSALDRGAPTSQRLAEVSWRLSLAVASSLAGNRMLPLAHVRVETQGTAGRRETMTLELTLPELRAMRAQVRSAIAAIDRA